MRQRSVAVVVGLVTLSVFAGCDRDEDSGDSGPLRPSASPSAVSGSGEMVPPAQEAQLSALAAYMSLWSAYNTAVRIPDPASRELGLYATGQALQTLVKGLRSVQTRGLKGEGDIRMSPRVIKLAPSNDPRSAEIRDCFDDGATRLVRAKPGPPFTDTPGGLRLTAATVERQSDGTWKVSGFGVGRPGSCKV